MSTTHPIIPLLLTYRSTHKLKTTYTDKLPNQIDSNTGRLHPHYIQTGTLTGRLACKDPNLQNIPVRTKAGKAIRKAFIAPKGYRILSADYSQIELRIMAHLSQDKQLLQAFYDDMDIHLSTAAEVFNVSVNAVTSDQRRRAKAINFGLIYGMSSFGLARQLGIDRQTAQRYIDVYFERYPGVLAYMQRTREYALKKGYVETLFHRRLYIPDIQLRQTQRRLAAERAAINAPLQGTAADLIKLAMIAIDKHLRSKLTPPLKAHMIMQVHDELVFEVARESQDTLTDIVRDGMTAVAHLHVPLKVTIGVGDNWEQAH